MDLQSIFYITATIFMVLVILMIITIGVVIYFIRKRLLMLSLLARKPAKAASEIGAGIVEGGLSKILEWVNNKNSTRSSRR